MKISKFILVVTALICSRAMFAFFNDPEGPNLLIVFGAAAIIYALSLIAYVPKNSVSESKKTLIAILIQIAVVGILYFFLR